MPIIMFFDIRKNNYEGLIWLYTLLFCMVWRKNNLDKWFHSKHYCVVWNHEKSLWKQILSIL